MQVAFNHLDFLLPSNGTLSVLRPASMAVSVKRGVVWLTQDAHTEDHVLRAGETMRIRDDDPIVLSAFRNSEVELHQGQTRAPVTRALRNAAAWALRRLRPTIRQRARMARRGALPLL
ncbi:MAG: DUF2917 domain-containing protein [Burkholderiales bacterium]|nr:DUF2917 domain-containing protein [Burkholderiales bacterium]